MHSGTRCLVARLCWAVGALGFGHRRSRGLGLVWEMRIWYGLRGTARDRTTETAHDDPRRRQAAACGERGGARARGRGGRRCAFEDPPSHGLDVNMGHCLVARGLFVFSVVCVRSGPGHTGGLRGCPVRSRVRRGRRSACVRAPARREGRIAANISQTTLQHYNGMVQHDA